MASSPHSSGQTAHFGEFSADFQTGELFRNGSKLKLHGQPFEILAVLLEHPGRLVTREELRRRLWPSDTFVDFEHGLNAAVNRLREVLGDSADQPRFIETVPRRGYRFIQPVQGLAEPETVVDKPAAHKTRRAGLRLAAVLAVALTAIVGVAVRRYLSLSASRSPAPPMTAIPFTSFPGLESEPAFSPDSNQIAFSWNGEKEDNFDIYVKMIGGDEPLRLTSHPGIDRRPVWSPDGRFIAFHRHTDSEDAIFLVPALGGQERKLRTLHLGGTWVFEGLDWSSDGKTLVFFDRPPGHADIGLFIVSIENPEDIHQLTSTATDAPDPGPRFSPDGKTVAFSRFLNLASSRDMFIVSAVGGEPKRLTFDKALIHGLTWTPDGAYIIFSSERLGGGARLWKIRAAGGDPEPLPVGQEGAVQPRVSRDGHYLAYSRFLGDTNIWRYPIPQPATPSKPPTRLIASTQGDQAPHFSPDGQKITFASHRSGGDEIWMCDADGSNSVQLTTLHSSHEVGTPRWSPDGQQIAFDFEPEGDVDLYLLNIEEGRPRRLTYDSSNDQAPTWSRDGKWIYFSSDRTGASTAPALSRALRGGARFGDAAYQIWKISPQGGTAVQVTKNGGYSPAYESPDGKSLYYSKGFANAGIWKMPVAGGEETPVLDQPAAGFYGYWDLVPGGIYYYNIDTRDIEFFDFVTKRVSRIATPLKPPIRNNPGFAVSPDRRSILFAQTDEVNSDIMLVENFRW